MQYKKFLQLVVVLFLLICTKAVAVDTVSELLHTNRITELESSLTKVQQRFEDGTLSEIELRDTFRPFYNLDAAATKNLFQWASSSPKSYVAHLALGIYFKRRGFEARGAKYIADTPEKNIERMSSLYDEAAKELRTSLSLTRKPYLSTFHLLTISMQFGDRETSLAMLREANRMLPGNSLVRGRYAVSLTPRWGGSYEELDDFIAQTKAENPPQSVLLQLQAIAYDDKGHTLEEQHQHAAAMEYFQKALALADRVGGTFATDWLVDSRYYACSGNNTSPSCR